MTTKAIVGRRDPNKYYKITIQVPGDIYDWLEARTEGEPSVTVAQVAQLFIAIAATERGVDVAA